MIFSEPDNPRKLRLAIGDLDPPPHLKHGFLGPTRISHPNRISISSAVFAGLTRAPNR